MKGKIKLYSLASLLLVSCWATPVLADATAYVVHGIPGDDGLPVDISVNGDCALTEFTFGTIAGPLSLPAGSYDIAIRPANTDDPCSEDPLLTAPGVVLEDGVTYSIVAHLTADGVPTASVFVNDVSPTAPGKAITIDWVTRYEF